MRSKRVHGRWAIGAALALAACNATVTGTTMDAGPPDAPADAPPDAPPDATADAPPRDCATTAECPAAQRCVYAVGCGVARGRCEATRGCESLPVAPQFCGCDGATFVIPNACPPDRPWRAEGPCPDAGAPRRYADAVMAWQSPGGVAGHGPAVLVTGDGVVRFWRMRVEFDPYGAHPPADRTLTVSTADVDDLFARWEAVPTAALPHPTMVMVDCYPTVRVRTCAACPEARLRYTVPAQLLPEMDRVWQWFDARLGADSPRAYCDRG